MDTSHYSLAVHRQTQPQSLPQSHFQTQPPLEYPPPSKRRRANSATPSSIVIAAKDSTTSSTPALWQSHQTPHLQPTEHTFYPSIPRSNSPDQISHVSTVSNNTSNGPQLRKKPKSSSIKNTNILRITSSAIPKSPSLPAFHLTAQAEHENAQNPGHSLTNTGSSVSRANSGISQHQSPNQKRPPASHSSYGVETTCGPPPSYSTQRTLSQERIRKVDRNSQARTQSASSDSNQANTFDNTYDTAPYGKESSSLLMQSSPETVDTHSIPTPPEVDISTGVKIRGQRTSMDEETKASSSDERRSEDLFLSIAKVDSTRPSNKTTEKRRSRISIPFLPTSRAVHAVKSSPTQPQFESHTSLTPGSEAPRFHSKRASMGGYIPAASSSRSRLVENGRSGAYTVDTIPDQEPNESAHPGNGLRRSSTTNTDATRLIHRSSAGLRSGRFVSESMNVDPSKTAEQITTESTVSTTAPSTVWDELDDLKSRIRKLELTGKLPPSSAAAMTTSERPRTATTAATTMSTSPKYKQSEANPQSTVKAMSPSLHPLLHEALDNARNVVSHDVYQKLQATAQDALQLAAMMNGDGSGSRASTWSLNNERQIKRRTESMCRGLTELAIALAAEAKPAQSAVPPASRDQSLPPNSMLRTRRYSNDPADRTHLSSRVQSRLDSRRTSLHGGRNGAGLSSPERGLHQSSGSTSQFTDTRNNRSSTLLRKRGQGSFDGADDQYETSPSIRPGSRAVTELGTYRRISRDQMLSPQGFTSQHPLPTRRDQATDDALPPAIDAPLPKTSHARMKYASPAAAVQNSSPMTPREAWSHIPTGPTETDSPDVTSEAGGFGGLASTRRSLGFAGRLGPSVGSRLRAARAERDSRENINIRSSQDMAPYMHGDHITPTGHVDVYQMGDG